MARKNKISIAIFSIIIVGLIIMLVIAVYALRQTLLMEKEKTYKNTEVFLQNNGVNMEQVIEQIDKHSEKIILKSKHGHTIPVRYMLSDNNYDNITMVLVHGHDMNSISTYPIAQLLLKNGVNVVVYDQRSHGENTAKKVTFGYYEKDDLEDVVNYITTKMTKKNTIGLLGQSMGAATVGFYSGTGHAQENIKFVVLDCPYNNMKSILKNAGIRKGYKESMLKIVIGIGSIANKLTLNFAYNDMNVCDAIQKSTIPTLVYSTKDDKTCPYYMADEVFDSIRHGNKEKMQFKESGHIRGFYNQNDTYVRVLLNFIEKYK